VAEIDEAEKEGFYLSAVKTSVGSLLKLFDKTKQREAYNTAYQRVSQVAAAKRNMESMFHAEEINFNAVKADRLMVKTQLQMKRDDALALGKVNAAAAGVDGGSVEQSQYQHEVNKQLRDIELERVYDLQSMEHASNVYQLTMDNEAIKYNRQKLAKPWMQVAQDVAPLLGSKVFANGVANATGQVHDYFEGG